MITFSIYKFTNLVNGKIYIGKTKDTNRRRHQHIKAANDGSESILHRAIRKHGILNFSYDVIDTSATNDYEHNVLECYFIEKYDCCIIDGSQKGYNMTRGGDGGDTSHSPNYKMAIANRNATGPNNPMFGKFGITNPNYGRKNTDETKTKQRIAHLTLWEGNVERKLLASHRSSGMNNSQYGKTPKNATPITINGVDYKSLSAASKATKTSIYNIKKLRKYDTPLD